VAYLLLFLFINQFPSNGIYKGKIKICQGRWSMRWFLSIFSGFMVLFTTFAVLFVVFAGNDKKNDNRVSPVQLTCATVSDSVEAFATFPVTVNLSNAKHVKTVTLRVDGNRLWTKPDSSIVNCGKKVILPVSFNDTGFKQIHCSVKLDSGDSLVTEKYLHVFLPLLAELNFKGSDSLVFSTTPVKDSVIYVWQFEEGPLVYSEKPQVVFPISELKSASGTLFVTDNRTQSAVVPFSFVKANNESTGSLATASSQERKSVNKINDSLDSDSRSIRIVRDTVVFHDTVFLNDMKFLSTKKK
jgi:hypothetical protein